YCEEHGLPPRIHQKQAQKIRKPAEGKPRSPRPAAEQTRPEQATDTKPASTRLVSLELYREGRSIPEIAAIRNLTEITVENHLAHFIETGELDIHAFVSAEKLQQIRSAAAIHGTE